MDPTLTPQHPGELMRANMDAVGWTVAGTAHLGYERGILSHQLNGMAGGPRTWRLPWRQLTGAWPSTGCACRRARHLPRSTAPRRGRATTRWSWSAGRYPLLPQGCRILSRQFPEREFPTPPSLFEHGHVPNWGVPPVQRRVSAFQRPIHRSTIPIGLRSPWWSALVQPIQGVTWQPGQIRNPAGTHLGTCQVH